MVKNQQVMKNQQGMKNQQVRALRAQRNKILAISKRQKTTETAISFTPPFNWSPRQLGRFLQEPHIAQLLVDPEGE